MVAKIVSFVCGLFAMNYRQDVDYKSDNIWEYMDCIGLKSDWIRNVTTNKLADHETEADTGDDFKAAEYFVRCIDSLLHSMALA